MATKNLVLIVDDEKNIRRLLAAVVEKSNLGVVECADIETAKEVFLTNWGRWMSVFVDYQMPGGNGVELVEFIRRLDRSIPVVAITARDESHKAFLAAGVDAILAKPFCVKTVAQMVNQYACRGASSGRLPAIGGGCADEQRPVGEATD